MKNTSWIVLGRGIIGLTAAFRLLQDGFLVTVIGPKSREGIASVAALGNFTAKGLVVNDHSLLSTKLMGQRYLQRLVVELERETGTAIPKISGVFEVFENPDSLARLRQRIYHNNFSALLSFEVLNRDQTKERSAFLRRYGNLPENGGSLFYPEDFWVDPIALLDALESAILLRGGKIIDGICKRLRPSSQDEMIIDFDQGHVAANEVLIAAGVHTNKILVEAELPAFPLFESAGITFEIPAPDQLSGAVTIGRKGLRVWNSSMRFGSYEFSDEEVDPIMLRSIDDNGFISKVANHMLIDSNRECTLVRINGTRSYAKDRLPLFGRIQGFSGYPNLRPWVSTAFYKIGFYLADFCAQNLVLSMRNKVLNPFSYEISPGRPSLSLNV